MHWLMHTGTQPPIATLTPLFGELSMGLYLIAPLLCTGANTAAHTQLFGEQGSVPDFAAIALDKS